MKIIKQSKIDNTLNRQAEIQKIIDRLEAEGHTQKAKYQSYFLQGLKIALDDLTN